MFTYDVIKARKLNTHVNNVIYHKFSHGAVSYTLNGENVNVMLEFLLKVQKLLTFFSIKNFSVFGYKVCKSLYELTS